MKLYFLALCVSVIFNACAKKVVYHEIKVPVKCDIEMPTRPSEHLEALEYLKALLIYTETLENDLKFCTKTKPNP
ncbi:putative adenine specific DNA methyltransferase [Helicobacter pylori Hp A-11]|uniref:Putative adenine specific DNA methyltransferase n=1 Tax=Helicobacter pylori Hp A-11 TaxID=992035 RepID=N4TQH6_HELPX|nr:hypothetical protein [Helicobacter pylori]ENH59900.1 putative adenine specific DNA methyltransferase [Helicobacter pylori Hp A-11]